MIKYLVFSLLFSAVYCEAAVRSRDGSEPGFWNSHAVIIGVVNKIGPLPKSNTRVQIRIKAVALTTRMIDTTVDLDVHGLLNAPESALFADLHPGDLVIACMEVEADGWKLPSDGIGFMPSNEPHKGSAICVIPSLDDALVKDSLDMIRHAYLSSVSKQVER